MNEKEVKKEIGEDNWDAFLEWMRGQTVGMNEDGTTDFYECDVRAFKHKLTSGHDRQNNPITWD
jgi:hypothetical protein